MNSNKEIAKTWLKCFNIKDLEGLLTLYNIKAQHYSPKLKLKLPESKGLIMGKEALRRWWLDAFERLPDLNYELVNLIADDKQVFIEYIRRTKNEEDLRVGEVLQIENGLIVFSRVYHG